MEVNVKLLIGLLVSLVLLCRTTYTKANGSDGNDDILIDCHPERNATEEICKSRNCIWNAAVIEPGAPLCTFRSDHGYVLVNTLPTDLGYSIHLKRKDGQPSIYGNDVDDVYLNIEFWANNVLRLKFYDPNNARYEVPIPLNTPSSRATEVDYRVDTATDPQFGVFVPRLSTNTNIFDTRLPGFVFSDQFLQVSTRLSSQNVYGLGEQRHQSYAHDMNWRTWTMFARDIPPIGDENLYGVQPFYMNIEEDGNANGVFLLNSNAMEVALQPSPALTYRTIGGILDLFIFLGPTPENVVEQYTSVIGRPLMPPYWSLGFQLCRWGYENSSVVRQVIERTRLANIPQDVQWTDIDYMNDYIDFTKSNTTFADLPDLIQEIHDSGMKYVTIIDAGIAENPNTFPYQEGIREDVFVKYNGEPLHGQVWPGPAVYPDFTHENSQRYWTNMFQYLYNDQNVQYDGIWTDMNEPSNFYEGSATGCNQNSLNYPPYSTHAAGTEIDGRLFSKTICMDVVQQGGRHYDLHSLYAYQQSEKTFNALKQLFPGRRPVVVTRSQFAGSNRHASHWLGDNSSTWQSIKDAIIGILEYNIFGMPFAGADICGFNGPTNEELCLRWMQVGAFYPFSRNHNAINQPEQDPAILGQRVIDASIRALTQRYRLLPFLYTLLQKAHDQGSTVARPLLHEFPQDSNTWNISTQFLWGSALMISPVLDEGVDKVTAYFPDARWYDYYTGAEVNGTGASIILDAPLDGDIPLHVAGGNIIPTQEPGLTTGQSRNNSLGFIVALDDVNTAFQGNLFWDDGETPDTRVTGHYNEFQFVFANNILDVIVLNNGLGPMNVALDDIKIYGLAAEPTAVKVDNVILDPTHIAYDADTKVLELQGLNLNMPANHEIALN